MNPDYQRLENVLCYLKLNPNSLAKAIGLRKPDVFYHIKRGRNGISANVARMITDTFQEISYKYLYEGKGDMIISNKLSRGDRVKSIFERTNLSSMEFCSRINYDDVQGFIRVVKGNISPSQELIDRIVEEFPDISATWLYTGVGEMKSNKDFDVEDKSSYKELYEAYKKINELQEELRLVKEKLDKYKS